MKNTLLSPYPWFGGKSRAAGLIWPRLGDVDCFVEAFAGSLAVLLQRPSEHARKLEIVNDRDCLLVNFWRAVAAEPDKVARYASWPVCEIDLVARNAYLADRRHLPILLKMDPEYYDAKIAGWWVWGLGCWLGSGWGELREVDPDEAPIVKGRRAMTKLPNLRGSGIFASRGRDLPGYFGELRARLAGVRIVNGDWRRVLAPSCTTSNGLTGVLLDPPYAGYEDVYAAQGDEHVSVAVGRWARENGDNPRLRIALCGYEGEHDLPGWECVAWKAVGGFANQRGAGGNGNRHRERVWFSPHCLKAQ